MDFSTDIDTWGREKLIEARHQLKTLVASPGWQLYCLMVGKQINARTDALILQPLENLDGALAQEYGKGEVAAMRMVLTLPETLTESITSNLAELKESDHADEE